MEYLRGRAANMDSEAAQNPSAPAQLPAQPPTGEPAPTPIPTPKMLNPPPYILPGAAVPNQAGTFQIPPNLAVPNQAPPYPGAPKQAAPNQAAPIQAPPFQAAPASSAAAQMVPKEVVAPEQAVGTPNAPADLGVGLALAPANTIQVGLLCVLRNPLWDHDILVAQLIMHITFDAAPQHPAEQGFHHLLQNTVPRFCCRDAGLGCRGLKALCTWVHVKSLHRTGPATFPCFKWPGRCHCEVECSIVISSAVFADVLAFVLQQEPLAPSAPAASVPLADGVPMPTSTAALIHTSA